MFIAHRNGRTTAHCSTRRLLAVASLALSPAIASAVNYTAVDLGTLGGTFSFPDAINAHGQVTGAANTAGNAATDAVIWSGGGTLDLSTMVGSQSNGAAINDNGWVTGDLYPDVLHSPVAHAFLWNGAAMQDLGTLGGGNSHGVAINANGWTTGYSDTADSGFHAYLWNGSTMQDLGTLGGSISYGYAINSNGWIAGLASVPGDMYSHAFVWNGSSMLDLGTLGGNSSVASAINSSGWATGFSDAPSGQHAFVWNGSTMQDIGTLGGAFSYSYGTAINNSGWVTGYSATYDFFSFHAFVWNGSSMQDIGTLGGRHSVGAAINSSGWVTGNATTASEETHASVWDGSNLIDLNDALPAGSPFVLANGWAINDAGQVIADGHNPATGEIHAFLLNPFVPFDFTGFFAPVQNPPATNAMKAGRAVPVKFSLGGDQGLNVFAPGYPVSNSVNCATLVGSVTDIQQTTTAGASGLKYDAASGQYSYVWNTSTTWANSCRSLTLKFTDGSVHVANFIFSK